MSLLVALVTVPNGNKLLPLGIATTVRTVRVFYVVTHADIEAAVADGKTPLMKAVDRKWTDGIMCLLALGANTSDDLLLFVAIANVCADQVKIVTALLEAGADANARYATTLADLAGYTPLLVALDFIDDGNLCVGCVRALLKWGADPTRSSIAGRTVADALRGRPKWNMSGPFEERCIKALESMLSAFIWN